MIYNGVSKLLAAEEQLRRAVLLFLRNEDPVSTHTLASAAQEILESLGKRQGLQSLKLQTIDKVDESNRAEFIKAMNAAKNSFKHADRDPDSIAKLNPEYTELVLWDAANLFYQLTQQKVPAFVVYDLWIYSKYPEMSVLKFEAEPLYEKTLDGHTYHEKEIFLDMISQLESELRKKIMPNEEMLHFENKNFGPPAIFLDPDTKVWNIVFPLNGERPDKANEAIMLNFYLKNLWARGVAAEQMADGIAQMMTKDKSKLIGTPFQAPDNITQRPAFFIWSFHPEEDHGEVYISKVSTIGDAAFSIIYRKKIMGSGNSLVDNIGRWLLDDMQSNLSISKEIGNTGMDESWLSYLANRQDRQSMEEGTGYPSSQKAKGIS